MSHHWSNSAMMNPTAHRDFTPREKEVLALVVDGWANPEIAIKLDTAPCTVAQHVASLLDKCGVANRVMLAVYAVRHVEVL